MSREKKKRKIVFSETIDSTIRGFALGFSFLGVGCFLLLKPDYFFVPVVSYIFGAIIGALGFMGVGVELSKASTIKGSDNLTIGLVFLAIWAIVYVGISTWWANILAFFPLLVGTYGTVQGLIQGIYSIICSIKLSKTNSCAGQSKGKVASQIVLFLTQLCGLALAVLNVIKAASV